MNIKALRTQRLDIANKAKAIMDAHPDSMLPADKLAEIQAMHTEIQALDAQIAVAAEQATIESELSTTIQSRARNLPGNDRTSADETRIANAFHNFLMSGVAELSPEDRSILMGRSDNSIRNAAGVTTGVGGGFLVPEGFYQHLIEAQLSYGGMMTCGATILDSTTGNPLPVPLDNDTYNTAYIQGENTQMTPGVDVAFGQMVLTAYMYTTRPILVSLQFLQDSAFDIDSWLPSRLQTRIMRRLNTDFTVGDGVGKPFGMLTQATLGAVGSTGETATLSYVDFINIQHSVDPAYRSNSKFMWNDKTLKALRLVTDNQNRPLWQPAISEAAPDTFGGSNYIINQDMPVPAANAKTILFGDFSAYMIRRVAGAIVMRLTERYADFLQVGYILGQRWDGNLADAGTHPVKYFQQSAT